MRHTTAVLLTAAMLAIAGCSSSGGEPEKETVTVTASPSLSEAESRAACVAAWRGWFDNTPEGYDAEWDPAPALPACAGRADSAQLGFEALRERNAENRARLDECLDDPGCTALPVP